MAKIRRRNLFTPHPSTNATHYKVLASFGGPTVPPHARVGVAELLWVGFGPKARKKQMGVPCEGGVYIPPAEGECCSICISLGDISGDGIVNVLDVVAMVNLVLSGGYDEVADMNSDGTLNVLDVVLLVGIILG